MYRGFALKITVGATTKEISYTIGVHQGSNLAMLLFNIFSQAALDSLESVCGIPIPKFQYFPTAKSGKPRGRLRGQAIAHKKEFSFEKSLYVDDSAFLFPYVPYRFTWGMT
eukprot:14343036-Ditylum_brightwellii.AAC.1